MHRTRIVPADPKRSTDETWNVIVSLVVSSLPGVPEVDVRRELGHIAANMRYLIGGEHLVEAPLTLVAGSLACDILTVHGTGALTTDDPAPAPGAAGETDWTLYVPVPEGAPFTASDLEDRSAHVRGGTAPSSAGKKMSKAESMSLSELVDPEALRRATL